MAETVGGAAGMIAAMQPSLIEGEVVFCSLGKASLPPALMAAALATFHEAEGLSLILPLAEAAHQGFDTSQPMRQITLGVFSALDGVGLTAAVAKALAGAGVPCNVVAAFHHDHVFVPAALADTAMAALISLEHAGPDP